MQFRQKLPYVRDLVRDFSTGAWRQALVPPSVFQFSVVQSEEKFGWTGLERPGQMGPSALLPAWGEGLRADKAQRPNYESIFLTTC